LDSDIEIALYNLSIIMIIIIINVQSDSIRTKVLVIFNYVIPACILLFLTPFLHFHTFHTFNSSFYIYTYAKFLSSLLSLIMTDVRSKRCMLLPLVFTSNYYHYYYFVIIIYYYYYYY